jgi:hypothetical protein
MLRMKNRKRKREREKKRKEKGRGKASTAANQKRMKILDLPEAHQTLSRALN